MKNIIATLLSLLSVLTVAGAQPFLVVSNPAPTVQLAWDIPSGQNITNCNLYYGVGSGQYTNKVALGNVTNTVFTVPTRGVQFFFAITVQASGLQSPFSNEVSYTAPNVPSAPTVKPLVVLTVMKSSRLNGVFADTGMNWSEMPSQDEAFYMLKVNKGIILSGLTPPMPTR